MTCRASTLLVLVGLVPACTVSVDPGAVVIDLPGFGGSGNQPGGGADSGVSGSAGEAGGASLADAGAAVDGGGCSVVFVTPSAQDVPATLGPADDGDGTPCGSTFTTDVVLASNAASVTLFVDGSPRAAQLVSGESVSFEDVLLGSRTPAVSTLLAVATMPDGSNCQATLGSLGVDCAGPTCTLSGPNNQAALTSADDTDALAAGLQTSFSVSTDPENGGTTARLILDGDVDGALTATVEANTATFANVTLAEGPARTVQGECSDQSGNITRSAIATWSVTLDREPSVEIASPAGGAVINVLGTSGATADLDPGSDSCELDVVVRCSLLDAPVVLLVDGAPLPQEAQCEADEGVEAPFVGTATFASISLSALGSSHSIAAQQTQAGLVGTSASVAIATDCAAPVLAVTDPLCGGQLHVVDDDQGDAVGLQQDVTVSNGGVAQVALEVTRVGSSQTLTATGNESTTAFPDVDLGAPGDVTLTATATDALGNVGTATCLVTVVVEPTVNILQPTELQVLSTGDDCEPAGGGFGITVSGTTSADLGSDVAVAVGSTAPVAIAPVAAGGGGLNSFAGCVPVEDGVGQTVTVVVTEEVNPPGSDTVSISVDTLGPTAAVLAPLASVTNRRPGQVTFTWDHVTDADGSLLAGYDLRCAPAPIGSEAAWSAARQLSLSTTGAAEGSPQATELIPDECTGELCRSFRVGTTEFCTVRGRDIAGSLTPLDGTSGSVAVSVPFATTAFTGVVNGNSSFTNVVGLGDVNGDGAEDMLYGVTNAGLQLFFGATSPGALDTSADVSFTNGGVSAFGAVLSSVGDVNGDGIGDFAASARALASNAGTVYLFFGRASNTWPPSVTVNAGGCGADVCLVGSVAGGFFGWDIAGTDFNGDGTSDLVISARATSAGVGAVYVILGGAQLQVAAGTSINVPSGNPSGFVLTPPASRSNFGVALAAVGTGEDNRGDLAIASNGAGSGNPAALFYLQGEAYPVGGSGLIAPSAALLEVAVGSSGDYGAPVRPIGDFDGDGLADLALGRSFSSGGGLGMTELYRRNGTLFTSGPGFRFEFGATGVDNDYGSFIASGLHPSLGDIGDLDGDGRSELAVGSLAGASGGSVALFYGADPITGRLRNSADFTLVGSATSVMVPNYVGDIDGDGFDDLAVVDGGAGADRVILLH